MRGKEPMQGFEFLTLEKPDKLANFDGSLIDALKYEMNYMIHNSVQKMVLSGLDELDSWNNAMPFDLKPLCQAYYNLVSAQEFQTYVDEIQCKPSRNFMQKLNDIHLH